MNGCEVGTKNLDGEQPFRLEPCKQVTSYKEQEPTSCSNTSKACGMFKSENPLRLAGVKSIPKALSNSLPMVGKGKRGSLKMVRDIVVLGAINSVKVAVKARESFVSILC